LTSSSLKRRDSGKLIGSPNASKQLRPVPVDDLDDAPLLHAKHRERERTVARFARRPQVDGERGLQVRGGSENQVLAGRGVLVQPPYQTRQRAAGREARVDARERGERREVPTLKRLDVAPRDLALRCGRTLGSERTHIRVRRVDAQPDRDPVNSAEKHMPGHAGVPRDPCAAIVVAVVAGDVRAFRAKRASAWTSA